MQPERLRSGSLNFVEVLAASLALIGLSMTPVLIAPGMYGSAGNGSWLAYVFGGVMLLLVAFNLNHFMKRSAGAGSMFLYAAQELGPLAGSLAGWSLVWAYVFVGAANFGAQALFIGQLAGSVGIVIPALATMAGLGVICWLLAVRDIALSTIVMLALETVSVAIICVLIAIVLYKHGPSIDQAQLHLSGIGKASIGLGLAFAIFSFVGFESATAFGDEAKNPLVTIPRAVLWSVIIAGAFFVLAMYTEILGLRDSKPPLDQLSAPLWSLADAVQVGYLKIPIIIGAICSSFSVALACVNTAARILLPMAKSGILPKNLAAIHPRFATPYAGLGTIVVVMFLIGGGMFVLRVAPLDIFNICGTLSALAFIVVYTLIAVAAPLYLRRIGELRAVDVIVSSVTVLFLLGTAATLFNPAFAPPPTNRYPYIFIAYLCLGAILYVFARRRTA
ncbi:MAG: APC family permease [Candidatus Eremiobacteraeota bacterium]|nr:APC family permease [Candidatus Eremiobacteraeota bacterium]